MLDLSKDIRSLSDFKRHSAGLMKQLKKTGRPLVLTVNGRAGLVLQEASAYQKILDLAEKMEAVQAIRRGLKDVEEGRVHDARDALERLRATLGIPG